MQNILRPPVCSNGRYYVLALLIFLIFIILYLPIGLLHWNRTADQDQSCAKRQPLPGRN